MKKVIFKRNDNTNDQPDKIIYRRIGSDKKASDDDQKSTKPKFRTSVLPTFEKDQISPGIESVERFPADKK
ncbi:hypothetical protein A2Y99_02740 [Candidatus Gottesmanbacteria bacterium RBG_13_37_7]|uniref:Uncharacterized protein n=1 Tax=Candidatus Gottesmanbacteria bacterium RBG_13_37_7 TaxID=1798369 RepID=A0A1F5YK59_9BACT|nr:MAG: hypothetical protein A2Y99_02740 [Candidatus Gottesmanbacteria bacterium RBG_13_37_7]